jgi:hypothetical protein
MASAAVAIPVATTIRPKILNGRIMRPPSQLAGRSSIA